MSTTVLVIGGTGMLGLPVARRLKEDGFDVTIMTSHYSEALTRLGEEFKLVEGDITDPETLRRPIHEADMVHISLNSRLDPELYQTIEIEGTANIASEAAGAGIKRISMISGASSKGETSGEIYLDAKVLAERAVIESGVPYSIMRPSWFYESLPGFVRGKQAAILGEQPIKRAWLAADDYARQVSNALRKDEAANKCFYNMGPLKMTMLEALEKFCARLHPEIKPTVVSFAKARMLASLPGQAFLRRAIPFFKYMEKTPEDVSGDEADRLLGPNLTTLDEWLDRYAQAPEEEV